MALRDLIPGCRSQDVTTRRSAETDPFLALRREMNRLFERWSSGQSACSISTRNILRGTQCGPLRGELSPPPCRSCQLTDVALAGDAGVFCG